MWLTTGPTSRRRLFFSTNGSREAFFFLRPDRSLGTCSIYTIYTRAQSARACANAAATYLPAHVVSILSILGHSLHGPAQMRQLRPSRSSSTCVPKRTVVVLGALCVLVAMNMGLIATFVRQPRATDDLQQRGFPRSVGAQRMAATHEQRVRMTVSQKDMRDRKDDEFFPTSGSDRNQAARRTHVPSGRGGPPVTTVPIESELPVDGSGSTLGRDLGSCVDSHRNCADWAAKGECDANAAFMLSGCRRACNTCLTAASDSNPLPAWLEGDAGVVELRMEDASVTVRLWPGAAHEAVAAWRAMDQTRGEFYRAERRPEAGAIDNFGDTFEFAKAARRACTRVHSRVQVGPARRMQANPPSRLSINPVRLV